MVDIKKSLSTFKPLTDAAALDREYELLKPITYRGEEVSPPTKVSLDDRQADWLRESGHIK